MKTIRIWKLILWCRNSALGIEWRGNPIREWSVEFYYNVHK